jgi:hypothetical protein
MGFPLPSLTPRSAASPHWSETVLASLPDPVTEVVDVTGRRKIYHSADKRPILLSDDGGRRQHNAQSPRSSSALSCAAHYRIAETSNICDIGYVAPQLDGADL